MKKSRDGVDSFRLGADPSIRDKAGRTAHDVARITGKENIRYD